MCAIIATRYKANINYVSPIVLIALTPSFIFSYECELALSSGKSYHPRSWRDRAIYLRNDRRCLPPVHFLFIVKLEAHY